jgi:hypothetical protein
MTGTAHMTVASRRGPWNVASVTYLCACCSSVVSRIGRARVPFARRNTTWTVVVAAENVPSWRAQFDQPCQTVYALEAGTVPATHTDDAAAVQSESGCRGTTTLMDRNDMAKEKEAGTQ